MAAETLMARRTKQNPMGTWVGKNIDDKARSLLLLLSCAAHTVVIIIMHVNYMSMCAFVASPHSPLPLQYRMREVQYQSIGVAHDPWLHDENDLMARIQQQESDLQAILRTLLYCLSKMRSELFLVVADRTARRRPNCSTVDSEY